MSYVSTRVYFALVFLLYIHSSHSASPGVTVAVGSEALETGLSITLPNIITSEITNQTIASVAGTTRALGIFDVTYNITNIFLDKFQFGDLEISIIDEGFEIKLTGITCNVTFDWYYRDQTFFIIHVSDSGEGMMTFTGGEYEIKLKIKEDDGRPKFDLTKNNLALGNVDLELDGGADWFYDLFNFVITPVVKSNVQDAIQNIVSKVFGKLNSGIQQIPTTIPLVENIAFDWSLISDFDTSADDGYGSFYSLGYFVPQNNINAVPPFVVETLPRRADFQTFQLIISEFTFESLGWALYEAGSLNITIPFGTTSDWRLLLPALYRAYPEQPVEVNFLFPVYPSFTVNSTGLTVQAVPYMNWNVVNNDTSVTNAFTLLVQMAADIDLYFEDSLLHGKAGIPTFDLSLYSTNIGDFSLFQLETAINTALYVVLLPSINSVLRQGIPIPAVYGVTLANPTIEFETGYMYVSAGLETVNSTATSFYSFVPYPMINQLFSN